ncbi:MAG: hypothetical protein ACRD1T_27955, partial [Acidimicrobiia bacterium]
MGTSTLLAIPIPLSAVAAYFGVGGEIRILGSRSSALAVALYVAGLLMASIWTQFALMRAVRASATGEEVTLSQTIGSISDGPGFLNYAVTKILYEGLKIVIIAVGFIPALGAIIFSVRGSGGRIGQLFQAPVVLVFLLAILVGVAVAIALSLLIVLIFGLTPAVAALEMAGPIGSFRRSRELLSGRKLDFFMLLFLRNLILQI